jgi:uncharacterized membrane protein YraQ (UPF0718 family)
MEHFIDVFLHYLYEVMPALAAGFLISGFVHEMIPEDIVLRYLGKRGIVPILVSALVGTLLPICCWGCLPIAVSFYKKGAGLGPVLAFLVATPATSISALLVAYSVLGPAFAIYIFFAVIAMGIAIGVIGNMLNVERKPTADDIDCPHCRLEPEHARTHVKKTAGQHALSALKYACVDLPKEIGPELFLGLTLATIVAAFVPIGHIVKTYLSGWFGYAFGVIFGIITYICSTASVPFVDSLIGQGMSRGAGMTLLLIGPVTSYGTILVLKKEYGLKVLTVFLVSLTVISVLLGIGFQYISR